MSVRTVLVVVSAFSILVLSSTSCGSDDSSQPSAVTVNLSADSIDAPDEISAGVVEVTIETDLDPTTVGEVDFSRVEPGTTEEEFIAAISTVIEGGPFSDVLLNNAGVDARSSSSTVVLEPGSYFVWAEPASSGDDGGPSAVVAVAVDVTGSAGGELPDTDGVFSVEGYTFGVDVAAGDTYTFVNEGPDQFHHVVLFGFGDTDPSVVEEHFVAFMASEEGELPEALEGAEIDFEVGGSGVFGPGAAGTFEATLEAGETYVAVCFIQDLEGGEPHAFAHDMWEVFTVG